MEASEDDDFYCPLCGCSLLWMPVSHIFVCEHCKESFSESAKYYLRKKEDATEGNQMKIREALELCVKEMCNYCRDEAIARGLELTCVDGCEAYKIAQAALAAPARQCDVGTAEEQAKRFNDFCSTHTCNKCVVYDKMAHSFNDIIPERAFSCRLVFSQMPYEAEEGVRK